MPFQVIFSQRTKRQLIGIITSFTAGEDFVAVCDTSVTLTATVVGDLTNHTFEWIQISGSPVTFITPLNQFSISYTQSNFDNKVFRFYIDKNTANEQFDDVEVFGAPTFTHNLTSPSPTSHIAPIENLYLMFQAAPASLALVENNASNTYVNGNLVWNIPPTPPGMFLDGFSIQAYTIGMFVNVASVGPTIQTYNVVANNMLYRVVADFKRIGGGVEYRVSNTVYVSGQISNIRSGVGADVSDIVNLQDSTFTRSYITDVVINTLTLVSHNPTAENVQGITPLQLNNISNVNIQTLSLISHQPPIEQFDGTTPFNASIISDVVVADLTGGQIGG